MSDNQETNCKGLGSHTCHESYTTLRLYKSKDELRKGLRHRNSHRMFASILVTFAAAHAGGVLHAARHVDGRIVVSNANVEALMLLFGGVLFVAYEFYLVVHDYIVAFHGFQIDTAEEESASRTARAARTRRLKSGRGRVSLPRTKNNSAASTTLRATARSTRRPT